MSAAARAAEFAKQLDREVMRIMHGRNEDVLIGMNGSYYREGEKRAQRAFLSGSTYGHAA